MAKALPYQELGIIEYYMTLLHPPFERRREMIDPIYLSAIMEANKLGAKGLQVVGAEMPHSAADDYRIKLIIMRPIPRGAASKAWFDE